MAKGMVNITFNVDSKGAISNLKAMGKATKASAQSAQGWAKAGFFASAGAKAFNLSLGLLKKALSALVKPIKDSIFEIGVLGDKIAKQSRMIGVTAEQFQVLEFAATRSGTSLTAVTNGMKKLGRVMVDAQNGSRQIKDTFDALGITLEKDNGTLRDTFDVFLELADKSMILGESAERTGVQMLLLGRSGTEVSNLMSQGAQGVLELKDELEALGGIMGEEGLANAESFVDRMADLEHAFRGVKIELGEHLMPEFTAFAQEFAIWLATTDFTEVKKLADYLLDMAIGMTRAADAALKLNLFPKTDRQNLQDAAGASEDLFNRLERGVATYEDLAASVRLFNSEQGEQLILLAKQQRSGSAGKFTTITPDAGPMKKTSDGLLVLRKEFQLTGVQIDLFNEILQGTDGDAEAAAMKIVDLGRATEAQAGLLILQASAAEQLEEANRELLKSFKDEIEVGDKLGKQAEERRDQIEKEREALRIRVASLEKNRKAEKELAASIREADRVARERARHLARISKDVLDMARREKEAAEALFDAFDRIDRGAVAEALRSGLVTENEFLNQMGKAANQIVRENLEERAAIIQEALDAKVITHQQADERIKQSEAMASQERVRLSQDTDAILMTHQANRVASWASAFGAMSDMVGTFSDLIAKSYGENTEEAKAAAKKMFAVQQALALGEAILMLAVGIAQANASAPTPYNIPAIVAATATGSAAIAAVIGTTIAGLADAGLPPGALKAAGLNNHSLLAMRNDEMVLDPVGTRHISEMLETQKAQMTGGGEEQTIVTTVELDGQVLGSAVDKRLIRQAERGIPYTGRIRQGYMAI